MKSEVSKGLRDLQNYVAISKNPSQKSDAELLHEYRTNARDQNKIAVQLRNRISARIGAVVDRNPAYIAGITHEDLEQVVLIKVLEDHSIQHLGLSFISRVARNMLIDDIRKSDRYFGRPIDPDYDVAAEGFESGLLKSLLREELLNSLGEHTIFKDRDIAVLRCWLNGESNSEIARKHQLTLVNVRQILSRTKRDVVRIVRANPALKDLVIEWRRAV